MNVGLKLLESEQMDCRRAGVVQTTLWSQMSVIASMVPMASMAPMASIVASMAPMASKVAPMVGAPMAVMVSMAWMELMAPELKSERESAVVWRTLLASHSPYQALCFAFCSDALLVQCY